MKFHIENMTCSGCARSVTKAIHSVDSQAEVKTDPKNRKVEVHSTEPREAFLKVLEKAGYPVE